MARYLVTLAIETKTPLLRDNDAPYHREDVVAMSDRIRTALKADGKLSDATIHVAHAKLISRTLEWFLDDEP